MRNITVFTGLDAVTRAGSGTVNVAISGINIPEDGIFDAKLGVIAYEGDGTIAGDFLRVGTQTPLGAGNTVSDALNPANNFFNSTRSFLGEPGTAVGDLPQMSGKPGSMAGYDLDVVDISDKLKHGDEVVYIQAGTTQDVYFLGAFITSISEGKKPCDGDDDCSVDKPACHPSGVCAECSDTNQGLCHSTSPVCYTDIGLCVPCLIDIDCPFSAPICLPSGACVQCTNEDSSVCGGVYPVCNTETGVCVSCDSAADCPFSAPICSASGACVECTDTSECGGVTPWCNTDEGVCAPCWNDYNCPTHNPACQPSGECRECSATNQAYCTVDGLICNTAYGVCDNCYSNAECPSSTPICAPSGLCVQCGSNNDCPASTPICKVSDGVCVPDIDDPGADAGPPTDSGSPPNDSGSPPTDSGGDEDIDGIRHFSGSSCICTTHSSNELPNGFGLFAALFGMVFGLFGIRKMQRIS